MADEFNLKLQDEGTFYLNAEGKIAWFNNMSTISDNYAFLVTGAMSNEIDETLRLKLFTLNGEPIILEGAEKIKLNREGSFTGPELLAELEQTADENFSAISNIAQLIVYDVNSSGKVISINTAVNNTANKSELRDKFSKDVEESDLIYKSASKQLDRYNISNNTIIFDIPKTSVGTDTEDFAVRSINMFVDKNKYDVSIYDLTADLTARALIVMNSDGDTNAESPIAVVKEISDTKNDEDIEVHKLYALMDGKEVEVYAKDKVTLYHEDGTLLQKGDIINTN